MFCAQCGHTIEDDSRFCRYCGAKQSPANAPDDVEPTVEPIAPLPSDSKPRTRPAARFVVLGVAFAIFLILIATCSQTDTPPSDVIISKNVADPILAGEEDLETPTPMPTASPVDNWVYSTDEDKVRSATSHYATTTSTNSIYQNSPYDSETRMKLTVRKHPAHGTDVILTITSGQMMCPSYDGCSGTVRFDDGAPQRVRFAGPSDNSSDTIFVENAASFIVKLKRAKRLVVEKTLYEAGNPQFEFNVHGLKWDH